MIKSTFRDFFKLEAAGGFVLLIAAVLAMVLKNSSFGYLYEAFLDTPGVIQVGALEIAKPLFLSPTKSIFITTVLDHVSP